MRGLAGGVHGAAAPLAIWLRSLKFAIWTLPPKRESSASAEAAAETGAAA